jgi:hypothetical protein
MPKLHGIPADALQPCTSLELEACGNGRHADRPTRVQQDIADSSIDVNESSERKSEPAFSLNISSLTPHTPSWLSAFRGQSLGPIRGCRESPSYAPLRCAAWRDPRLRRRSRSIDWAWPLRVPRLRSGSAA